MKQKGVVIMPLFNTVGGGDSIKIIKRELADSDFTYSTYTNSSGSARGFYWIDSMLSEPAALFIMYGKSTDPFCILDIYDFVNHKIWRYTWSGIVDYTSGYSNSDVCIVPANSTELKTVGGKIIGNVDATNNDRIVFGYSVFDPYHPWGNRVAFFIGKD